ncbi:iron-sulfur cluster co-chaperone protein HscB isoform X2 [Boleophthalmus pectinirostris]|uniref:iron-sulfur cluster co-chaperone protein HscB isoform X2 n=1 Tax=Boleophthalmus pectinirostris TaxID=150288 RepID=UPI002432B969|nr:iron-sulfur cluster co-chaperone protein HscB isoform X2 [Boleophthalmus pectinirostris]
MIRLNILRMFCRSRTLLQPDSSLREKVSFSRAFTCACCASKKDNSCSIGNLQQRFVLQDLSAKREVGVRYMCTTQVFFNCWNCKELLKQKPAFFCKSCQVVQPPYEGTSYFNIMESDCTFTLDTQKLQKKYLQLQRLLHPDNFSQKSEREQEYSESQSALVNKAYETLLKPLSRGLYMLELQGLNIEEGTDSAVNSELLMELMEINEALDAVQTPQEANEIGQDTKGKLADLTEQIDTALNKGELQTAKALLTKMKYFANIEEKVKEKLSSFM